MSLNTKKQYIIVPDATLVKGLKGDKGDKGEPGISGDLLLPISSDDVLYNGDTVTSVLDSILYKALVITGFSASTQNYEKGQSITSVGLSWSYNKVIQSQNISGTGTTPPPLLISDRSSTVTLATTTTNRTLTLSADDVTTDSIAGKSTSLTLAFYNKIYYGKSVIGTINSAFILALTGFLSGGRQTSFSISTSTGEYIWFAIPVAYGDASFKANGFDGGFNSAITISFTNASGWTENYYVYRSTNDNLGLTSIQVL